ncbi:MAG: DUF3592 domain-containing protein [Planctomycetota bacterium]
MHVALMILLLLVLPMLVLGGLFVALIFDLGLFFLLLTAVLGVITIGGTYLLSLGIRAMGWPTVEGRMRRLELIEEADQEDRHSWKLLAEYTYEVDGRAYESQEIGFFRFKWTMRGAEEQKAELERRVGPDGAIRVSYQPGRPGRSALLPGVGQVGWWWVGTALLLTACSAAAAAWFL